MIGPGLIGPGLIGPGLIGPGLIGPGLIGPGLIGPGFEPTIYRTLAESVNHCTIDAVRPNKQSKPLFL